MNHHFIQATHQYCGADHPVPAPYLRRSFVLDAAPTEASISVSGLGFYILTVNGKDITKGHIAPYISNPDDYCYYDTYEIASLLTAGENVIGLWLGNGFMNPFGGAVWDFQLARFRGAPRAAVAFSATVNGETVSFIADESFKVHPSPILFDDMRIGETYDARNELDGWDRPGFDDSAWSPAIVSEPPRGEMREATAEPITVMEERRPVRIEKQGEAYLYDFGINTAGICRLRIKGSRGQAVTMWHGEELYPDGRFKNDRICFSTEKYPYYISYNQTERYILRGDGEEVYTPKFIYYGFRYVLVEGITEEQATEDLLTYLVMSSDLRTIGGFSCSNERVNTLYRMAVNSDRSNFFYIPTDCPHREKNGWTGDASMSSDHMTLMYDVEKSYREWLANIRKSQREDGALPGIIPTGGWGFDWGNGPVFDSVIVNLPYMLYQYRGCTEVIRENASAILRYLSYAMTQRMGNGLVEYGLGDWVPVGRGNDKYNVPVSLVVSIMIMDIAKKAAEMFRAIGYTHEEAYALGIYREMREAIRAEHVDAAHAVTRCASQTGQAMCIYYGVFNAEELEEAYRQLVSIVHACDDRFNSGFVGMHVIFHALSMAGESELAYKMIVQKGYPSYGHLIDKGETSLVERFMPDDRSCSSHNHHFMGDIIRWFTVNIGGLHVVDHETVRVGPYMVKEIDFAEAFYDLPKGRVSVKWKKAADGTVEVTYSAPEGVTVRLREDPAVTYRREG